LGCCNSADGTTGAGEGSEEPTRRNGDGAAAGRSISSTQQDSIWRHVHACVLLLPESDATRGTGQQFGGRTEDMRQRRRMQAAGCCMLSPPDGAERNGTEQRTCCGQRSRQARKISIQQSRNRFYLRPCLVPNLGVPKLGEKHSCSTAAHCSIFICIW
jgi:hypothetical protein